MQPGWGAGAEETKTEGTLPIRSQNSISESVRKTIARQIRLQIQNIRLPRCATTVALPRRSNGAFAHLPFSWVRPAFALDAPFFHPSRSGLLNALTNPLSPWPAATKIVAAALAGAAAGWWLGTIYVAGQREADTGRWLDQVDHRLPGEIEQLARSNQALALLIEQAEGRFGPTALNRWAPPLLQGLAPATALSIAPQGRLVAIVPAPPTTQWRGVNLLTHPLYRTSSLRSVRDRTSVLQGPVPLLKGGMGLIVRTPVFVGPQQRFWGFVHGLGPWSTWLTSLEREAQQSRLPMAIGVEVRDGENKIFRTPNYTRIAATGLVGKPMSVPGGLITLAATPVGFAPSQKALLLLSPLTGAVLGAGLGVAVGQRQRKRQLQQLEQELIRLQAMARYRALFEASLDGVVVMNRDGQPIEANPAVMAMYGVTSMEAFLQLNPVEVAPELQADGRPSAEVAAEQIQTAFDTGSADFEYLHRRLDTGEQWLGLVSLRRIELEHGPVVMARVRDITASRRYEQRIEDLAYRDVLTGLANRVATQEWLEEQLQQQPDQRWLLINLDLDDFRSLNLAFGQEQGDQLLRHVAKRLQLALPEAAWLARLDSDEFLVIIPLPDHDAADAGDPAEDWCLALQQRAADAAGDLASPLPRVSISAGCTISEAHGQGASALELMQQANTALRQAKRTERAGFARFTPALSLAIQERLALEQQLEQALAEGQADQAFQLVYQPQVNRAGRVVRGEALLRFRHHTGAAVGPDRFIPLAERTGQIHRLGGWVLNAAFQQQALWRDRGLPLVPLSVNVSARQFDDIAGIPPLLEQLQGLRQRYGLEPRYIVLELTETALLHDDQRLRQQLQQLVAAGFKLALDDFGSGYSSLKVLRDYPVAQVKIDKSFVDPIGLDHRSCAIVQALVAITRARRMDLVAEGVETKEQRETLALLGLNFFQGYLFAPGLPADEFADLLLNPDALASPLPPRSQPASRDEIRGDFLATAEE